MAYQSENFGIKALLRYLREYKTFIVYCSANGTTTNVWFSNNEMRQVSCNIGEIQRQCPYGYLLRIHKSRLVNYSCINMVDFKCRLVRLDCNEVYGISVLAMKNIEGYLLRKGLMVIQKTTLSM